jgi:hypothetical protein
VISHPAASKAALCSLNSAASFPPFEEEADIGAVDAAILVEVTDAGWTAIQSQRRDAALYVVIEASMT